VNLPHNFSPRVIVALDFSSPAEALALVDRIDPSLCRLKIGKELFTIAGPELIKTLVARGYDLFLDLKFHDIPNTTACAVAAAADLGIWMVNVHASGGRRMMEAAVDSIQRSGSGTLLTAVTVLTSMDKEDLLEIGVFAKPLDQVLRLATLARNCGVDGVVCSPREAATVVARLGEEFIRVTPGIRPDNELTDKLASTDDQCRTLTPGQAIANGSSYLVIGRPVTRASDPRQALLAIREEIGEN